MRLPCNAPLVRSRRPCLCPKIEILFLDGQFLFYVGSLSLVIDSAILVDVEPMDLEAYLSKVAAKLMSREIFFETVFGFGKAASRAGL